MSDRVAVSGVTELAERNKFWVKQSVQCSINERHQLKKNFAQFNSKALLFGNVSIQTFVLMSEKF